MRAWMVFLLLSLTGAVIAIGGPLGAAGLLAVVFYLACIVRPDLGLAWSFLALPFALPQIQIAQVSLAPFEIFVWPATLFALAFSVHEGTHVSVAGVRQVASFLILGGYLAVMSVLFWGDRTPLELRMWSGAILFGLTCYARARRPTFRTHVRYALTTSAFLLASLAVAQHFFGGPAFLGLEEPRDLIKLLLLGDTAPVRLANLTFDHFNSAGAYTALLASVLFAAAMIRRSLIRWLGVGAALLALYLTYSRGAALGAIGGMLATALLIGKGRLRIAIGAVAALGVVGGVALVLPRVLQSSYVATLSLATRALIWRAYFEAWRSSPVFGLGPGNGFAMVNFLSPFGARYGAHNNFLYLMADFGIVGLVLVMGCLSVIAVSCVRMARSARRTLPYTVGATAVLVALLFHSLVDDTLIVFSYRVALLGILGIALRERREADREPATDQGLEPGGRMDGHAESGPGPIPTGEPQPGRP